MVFFTSVINVAMYMKAKRINAQSVAWKPHIIIDNLCFILNCYHNTYSLC